MVRIDDVIPTRYDGMNDEYVVCIPEERTHTIVSCVDSEGDRVNIPFTKDFEGNANLIDLL
jgi:hypothetical protein